MAANSSAIVCGGCQPNAARKALASTTSEPASRSSVDALPTQAHAIRRSHAGTGTSRAVTPSAAAIARANSGVETGTVSATK